MFKLALGNSLSYLLTAWFVVSFALITFSGVAFLGTLLYHIFF
jgi:hypothetical protein